MSKPKNKNIDLPRYLRKLASNLTSDFEIDLCNQAASELEKYKQSETTQNTCHAPKLKALTEDELREMDGQDITIVRLRNKIVTEPDSDRTPEKWTVNLSTWSFKGYGETWVACKRELTDENINASIEKDTKSLWCQVSHSMTITKTEYDELCAGGPSADEFLKNILTDPQKSKLDGRAYFPEDAQYDEDCDEICNMSFDL